MEIRGCIRTPTMCLCLPCQSVQYCILPVKNKTRALNNTTMCAQPQFQPNRIAYKFDKSFNIKCATQVVYQAKRWKSFINMQYQFWHRSNIKLFHHPLGKKIIISSCIWQCIILIFHQFCAHCRLTVRIRTVSGSTYWPVQRKQWSCKTSEVIQLHRKIPYKCVKLTTSTGKECGTIRFRHCKSGIW